MKLISIRVIVWLLLAFLPVLAGWLVVSFTIWDVLTVSEWSSYFRFAAGMWVAVVSLAIIVP